jgi:hypothetical protein
MMAYKVASTNVPGMGFRPFADRLGNYQRAAIVIPTQSYANLPTPGPVSGGLGLDLSSLTSNPLFWLAAAGAAFFFWKRSGRG